MAENSAIEWCDHTWSPWEGCQKVSPGCDNCYAEARNARFAGGQAVNWGPHAPRRLMSESYWRKPLQWNHQAAARGSRARIFPSLCDPFDNAVPEAWRMRFLQLIIDTPHLDWLLLTKRMTATAFTLESAMLELTGGKTGWNEAPLRNVWIGATACDQEEANRNVYALLKCAAARRFLSLEPLLGAIDLVNIDISVPAPHGLIRVNDDSTLDALRGTTVTDLGIEYVQGRRIDWVICGGESGPKARPMHPDWARGLRDQCAAAGVPFLFKQWGEWTEQDDSGLPGVRTVLEGDPEFESEAAKCDAFMAIDGEVITDLDDGRDGMSYRGLSRPGKKAAGRLLDGRTHDEFPQP